MQTLGGWYRSCKHSGYDFQHIGLWYQTYGISQYDMSKLRLGKVWHISFSSKLRGVQLDSLRRTCALIIVLPGDDGRGMEERPGFRDPKYPHWRLHVDFQKCIAESMLGWAYFNLIRLKHVGTKQASQNFHANTPHLHWIGDCGHQSTGQSHLWTRCPTTLRPNPAKWQGDPFFSQSLEVVSQRPQPWHPESLQSPGIIRETGDLQVPARASSCTRLATRWSSTSWGRSRTTLAHSTLRPSVISSVNREDQLSQL